MHLKQNYAFFYFYLILKVIFKITYLITKIAITDLVDDQRKKGSYFYF